MTDPSNYPEFDVKRMRLLGLLLPWLVVAPAFAGTVYVPYAANFELGGVQYQTQIWAGNDYPDILGLAEHYFIPSFTDGTLREAEPTAVWTMPGETRKISVLEGMGMLEVFASEEVHIQARLVPVGNEAFAGQGVEVPVISSSNVVPANQPVQLLGWERRANGAEAYSNFGLINMGHETTECMVDVYRADGSLVLGDVALTFKALSHNQFDQVLGLLGETDALNWRLGVYCDQPFFPYLSVYYPQTGRITFVEGAASGRSELQRPLLGVSEQFVYLSDLPYANLGGIEVGPWRDASGVEFHQGPPFGGFKPIQINGVQYAKGISFYPLWGRTPFLEFDLNGQYAVFTAIVRIDDHFFDHYEWAIVDASTGQWVRLERPSDGFRGRERENPIRIGAAATFQILGDGEFLFRSPEIYAYGDAVEVEIDVRGVDLLRLQLHPDGTEQLGAPHRNGLTQARMVRRASWHDMIDFADAKLFLAE